MTEQSTPVDALLSWLITMDDPTSETGMAARQTVTLTRIIDRARDVQRWLDLARTSSDPAAAQIDEAAPRLWQIEHPYYGADGHSNTFDSFAELRAAVDAMDDDMNVVYRWDWHDYREPHHDDLFVDGEFRDKQRFGVFVLMPRKSQFLELHCPITHDQENEVVEWLRGPRCAGYLRTLWEPILGVRPTAGDTR